MALGRMRAILSAVVFVLIGTAALVLAHPGEDQPAIRASAERSGPGADLRSAVAQHALQESAVRSVLYLLRSVDARDDGERLVARAHGQLLLGREADGDPVDLEQLVAGEAERRRVLTLLELGRQHAHADQVRAMDALEAL